MRFDWGIFERQGFLAGSDARRASELDGALSEPDTAAILAARGGYGLSRIVARANWSALRRAPKWIVGFSDITLLHVEAARVGVASLHAHNVAGMGRGWEPARREWCEALEAPHRCRDFTGLKTWVSGTVEGVLAGGNLSMLHAAHAAGRLRMPSRALLVLEEVSEAPYRLDRMLTALISSGALDRVAGVVLGDMTDCGPGRYGISASEVLRERLSTLRVPVLAGLPIGHGTVNRPVPLGVPGRLEPGRFRVCPG